MDRDAAREEIRSSWRRILPTLTGRAKQQMNGEDSFICPIPNCGHGKNGDGLTFNHKSRDGNGLKCFSCGFRGDIIDLYQNCKGVDYNTALRDLAAEIGITIEEKRPQEESLNKNGKEPATQQTMRNKAVYKRGVDYYKSCAQALAASSDAVSYLKGRGISLETAEAFNLGFDSDWRSPTAAESGKNPPKSRRLIIPTSNKHYFARSIDAPKNDAEKKYQKMNEGEAGLFNEAALYSDDARPVFITEGAFDALSIIEAGGNALALNSTSNTRLLVEALEANPSKKTLIICLDNDKAGREAAQDLRAGLKRINAPFIQAFDFYPAGIKDANEALQKDRDSFIAAVNIAMSKAAPRPDSIDSYIDNYMQRDIEAFKAGCNIKTGFSGVDKGCGGLFSGLYVLAAISSLGKTTFAHQIADYLAESGREVIYFSLEQSALELVTKSLARMTARNNLSTAVTSLSIRCGIFPKEVEKAHDDYREKVGNRLSIVEGNFNCTAGYIADYVRKYIKDTGVRPVVFVDYLQILQPSIEATAQGKRDIIDSAVTELKRLSRELGLIVFVICSVNRANYITPIDFESLKESGGIEYTADAVWGLQLQCLSTDKVFDGNNLTEKREAVKNAKSENPRKIEFVCLKNRSGKPYFTCPFTYYPAHDFFVDDSEKETEQAFSTYRRV